MGLTEEGRKGVGSDMGGAVAGVWGPRGGQGAVPRADRLLLLVPPLHSARGSLSAARSTPAHKNSAATECAATHSCRASTGRNNLEVPIICQRRKALLQTVPDEAGSKLAWVC